MNRKNPYRQYMYSYPHKTAYRRLTGMIDKSMEKGKPNLNLMFNYNMPFRAIAKMTGGICTMEMAEGYPHHCQRSFFKGLGRVIGGFFRAGKSAKPRQNQVRGGGLPGHEPVHLRVESHRCGPHL